MAAWFKRIITSSLAITLSVWLPLSWASDSTSGPFGGAPTPTTNRSAPYLLMQGYIDVAGNGSSQNARWDPAYHPTGYANCYTTAISGQGYNTCEAVMFVPKTCPGTDAPYINTYPQRSELLQGMQPGICPSSTSSVTVGGVNGYDVFLWSNVAQGTGASGNTTFLGVSRVGYDLYCYPPSSPAPVPSYSTWNCGPPSYSINYGSPVLWDSGQVDWPSGGETHTFTTNRLCPTNFSAYVTLSPSKIYPHSSNQNVMAGGACVQSSPSNGSSYTVTYLTNNMYSTINVYNFSNYYNGGTYSLRKNGDVNSQLWPSNDNWVNSIGFGSTNNYTDTGGLSWTVYCYPPGIITPSYQSDCKVGNSPF
jgi:hypothetical protein